MKKFLLIAFINLFVTSAFSQIADTKFGTDKNSVLHKLENRFGSPDLDDDISITYWDKSYAGYDWDYIDFEFKIDSQSNSRLYKNCLNKDFAYLESAKKFLYQLKNNLPYTFEDAQKETNVFNSYEALNDGIGINLYIYYDKSDKKKYSVWLTYYDNNIKYKEQDLNGSILYTTFGDTYSKTESKLIGKFGISPYSDRENIIYENIIYAGIRWNFADFVFNYTSSTNHLFGIVLARKCNNANEAKKLRDKICYQKFSDYNFDKYRIEDNGFKTLISSDSDKDIIVTISKNEFNSPYVVNVIIKSKLYDSKDKL